MLLLDSTTAQILAASTNYFTSLDQEHEDSLCILSHSSYNSRARHLWVY